MKSAFAVIQNFPWKIASVFNVVEILRNSLIIRCPDKWWIYLWRLLSFFLTVKDSHTDFVFLMWIFLTPFMRRINLY